MADALDRFMAKVRIDGDCWTWTAPHVGDFWIGGRRTTTARRWAWEHFNGRIGAHAVVLLACSNDRCVNPRHLRLSARRGPTAEYGCCARNRGKTHCPAGHPYDEENTMIVRQANGFGQWNRMCRECGRQKWRARYHARKATA